MRPQTYADLAHENLHLIVTLWRLAWEHIVVWRCRICNAYGDEKHLVRHAPGCALFGQDPALLAQIDAFDAMPEPV